MLNAVSMQVLEKTSAAASFAIVRGALPNIHPPAGGCSIISRIFCSELSQFQLNLNLLPLLALLALKERINYLHVLDRVNHTPGRFRAAPNRAPEGFGLQLILIAHRIIMLLADIHASALDERAIGLIGALFVFMDKARKVLYTCHAHSMYHQHLD